MKITEYAKATSFDSGDVIIKDGTNGTKIMDVSDALLGFMGLMDATMHANIYRGKYLGSSVTAAQQTAISNGTFEDLYVGDYWTINGVNYRIADIDYFYNCGDTAFTKHHLVIVPDGQLYTAQMNSSNTTEGGYVGSEMYTTNLADAKSTISTAFGELVLSHRDYFVNAVTDGIPSAGAWYDSEVELMNEIMVYGCQVFTSVIGGTSVPNLYTTGKKQLSLFRLNPKILNKRLWFWLRDVVSSTHFADVLSNGAADSNAASFSDGVRPYFVIGV
ncbi:MAG: hypothetical protein LUD27_06650 [Clostridia bacterium]|nr:hypothetical protein [Clostridia bacterium]